MHEKGERLWRCRSAIPSTALVCECGCIDAVTTATIFLVLTSSSACARAVFIIISFTKEKNLPFSDRLELRSSSIVGASSNNLKNCSLRLAD